MKRIVYILLLCVTLFLCSCNNNPQPPQRTDKYSLDSIMCLADKNLDAANLRIAEGEQNGEIMPFESATLHANITYKYTDNNHLAIDYCLQALSYLNKDDYVLKVYTYFLLAKIAVDGKDYYSCLNACTDGRIIARKHKMRFKEYSFDFISGKCNFDMGFQNEAITMMSSSIDKAVKVVELEDEYHDLISFVNDLISSYMAIGDMKNVVRVSKILGMLTDELEAKYPQNKNIYKSKTYQNPSNQPNNTFLIFVLILLVIIVIAAFVIIYRNNRQKLTDSSEKLDQIQKQVQLIAEEKNVASKKEEKTPKTLSSLVEGEKLYLNKDLSRVQVIKMLGCSHKTLTKMLNDIQPDLSFPDYIKGLRVKYALDLIKENPYLNVTQVADQSGFSSISSFERSFKSITGKTPKEYMKSQNN